MITDPFNRIDLEPAILSLGTAVPATRYSQEEVYALTCEYAESYRNPRVRQIFLNSDIDYRHLYFRREELKGEESSDELHSRFRRGALEIGADAIAACLQNGGIDAGEIGFLVVATCTGYLCPGLSSILIKQLGLPNDLQRADLVGMGCAGALPALQRGFDFVKAHPDRKALVLTVEICSACYYFDDSLETMVGNAICADGAAAMVIGTAGVSAAPKIAGFRTLLEPAYLDSVGFEQRDGKLRIILSKDIRDLAGGLAGSLVTAMLEKHRLQKPDVDHWIIHSGGRKVIDAIQKELHLSDAQIRNSRHVLRNYGNMSSPTVLFVLGELLRGDAGSGAPKAGDVGVMLALGPGLAVEGALLVW